jgi:hypothetical protein
MEMKIFELITPTEENGYCVFTSDLEDDEHVFFHMTPAENQDSIIKEGFRSAQELGVGTLTSVSYAKRSSFCFANLGITLSSGFVIFAVRFESGALEEIVNNRSDIHVYKHYLQPEILGLVRIPAGFKLP